MEARNTFVWLYDEALLRRTLSIKWKGLAALFILWCNWEHSRTFKHKSQKKIAGGFPECRNSRLLCCDSNGGSVTGRYDAAKRNLILLSMMMLQQICCCVSNDTSFCLLLPSAAVKNEAAIITNLISVGWLTSSEMCSSILRFFNCQQSDTFSLAQVSKPVAKMILCVMSAIWSHQLNWIVV